MRRFEVSAKESVDVRPAFIVSQHRDPAEKLIILTEKGVSIVEQRSPVDMLREVLRQYGADSPQANYFFYLHGAINSCVMALSIMCSEGAADLAIKRCERDELLKETTAPIEREGSQVVGC
ncbi:hypothetical protein Tcan_02233 [Toxocara canis]|uniref:Uncharacterized protein n=1 Tax=Toxocara canis TaxID=6265 RepID=A0A0B2UQP1_TOXCA|nr:hypothetical protein Tcan_02233 [Toxocara canis]